MTTKQKTDKQFVFFWGGYLSQWYPCKFIVRDVEYNCTEQYMMAIKAKICHDDETYQKIMASTDPKEQKKLGRQVKNFRPTLWDMIKEDVVYEGNYAKFNQNKELKRKLLDTYEKELVEASPYDTIWGVGLSATDPRIQDKNQWKGQNLLGKALMKVRDTLKESK